MSWLANVAFALLVLPMFIVFVGQMGRFFASFFLRERESKIAGFAFCIGMMAPSGSSSRFEGSGLQILAMAGAMMGLFALWWLFFKRERQHG